MAITIKGFALFCLCASSIYIFNDIKDIECDRLHPQKKYRPLANREISVKKAAIVALMLALVSLSGAFILNKSFFLILLIYMVLNIFYSLGLKNIPIIDLLIISVGFVMRVLAGGVLTEIYISKWIVIMTFLVAMFIALSKRYNDLLLETPELRKSIKGYNLYYVSQSMIFILAVIFVAYLIYTLSPDIIANLGSENLYLTSVFVLYGFLRYLQIVFVDKASADPTKVFLKDKPIIISVMLWLTTFTVLIYF